MDQFTRTPRCESDTSAIANDSRSLDTAHMAPEPSVHDVATSIVPLSTLDRGARAIVQRIAEHTPEIGDAERSTIGQRLLELGFAPGVEIEVIAAMWPGADPIAVRVRGSSFALRRREAMAVLVSPMRASGVRAATSNPIATATAA